MSGTTTPGSGDPAQAKRLARSSTMLALIFLVFATFMWFSWWNAQVNHIEGPRSKGFTEGDPFPWFASFPLAGLGDLVRHHDDPPVSALLPDAGQAPLNDGRGPGGDVSVVDTIELVSFMKTRAHIGSTGRRRTVS